MTGKSVPRDAVGFETLEKFSGSTRFNQWMADQVLPYCANNIIEIGSGIGNISQILLQHFHSVTVSDFNPEYVEYLKERFNDNPGIKGIWQIDLSATDFAETHAPLCGQFDTVIALNVVEHIERDQLALENARKLLKPGGRLIILVPAYPLLYNLFDKNLGHFKRYTRSSIRTLFRNAGLKDLKTWHFNLVGIFGWFVFGTLFRKTSIPEKELGFYNKIVPLARLADSLSFRSVGLSVITVGINK